MRQGRPPIIRDEFYIKDRSQRTKTGCWEWLQLIRKDGYGRASAYGRQLLAHRLSYCIATGMDLRDERLVLHRCANKKCVNPAHLYAGTQYENVQDYIRLGVRPKLPNYTGKNNPNAKLSKADCIRAEKMLLAGVSQSAVARHFKVSIKPIHELKHQRHWSQRCV